MTSRAVPNFRPSYLRYADEVAAAVTGVLRSGMVLQGRYVRECEQRLTQLTGRRFAVLFSSATTAIEALMSYRAGDVVTPTINFVSVPYVARKLGRQVRLRPRTRPLSGPMDDPGPGRRAQRWHVPLAGQAGDDYVRSVGPQDIEDASQCFMTISPWGMVGTLGLAGVYSFTFNKFATAGEGGCAITSDTELFEHLARYRDFGKLAQHGGRPIDNVGYNYRLSEVNAAMLSVQLAHAHETRDHMRELHEKYAAQLAGAGLDMVTDDHDNYTRVIVRVNDVGITRRALAEKYRIATPTPIMDYSIAEGSGFSGRAEEGWDKLLCLPFWFGLTDDDISYVSCSAARVQADLTTGVRPCGF